MPDPQLVAWRSQLLPGDCVGVAVRGAKSQPAGGRCRGGCGLGQQVVHQGVVAAGTLGKPPDRLSAGEGGCRVGSGSAGRRQPAVCCHAVLDNRPEVGVAPLQGLPDLGKSRSVVGRVPLLHWARVVGQVACCRLRRC
jgi:hypothetical protein